MNTAALSPMMPYKTTLGGILSRKPNGRKDGRGGGGGAEYRTDRFADVKRDFEPAAGLGAASW